jgi:hypothetical protein
VADKPHKQGVEEHVMERKACKKIINRRIYTINVRGGFLYTIYGLFFV